MVPALRRNRIKHFYLDNNDFANVREGIEFVVVVIKGNQKMKTLSWVNNRINNMEDAQQLVEVMVSHPSIDDIRLDSCFGGDGVNGYEVLQSIIAGGDSFTSISFSINNIRTGGDTTISDYIARNPPLKELCLESTNLNDEDVVLIARALKHNSNLSDLYLGGNNITEIGFTALRNAVYDPTSLNTVSDSNHTCYISNVDFGDNALQNFSPSNTNNRARKMYYLLSLRNREGSNVNHLNLEFGDENDDEDSIKLVPKVLDSVIHYSHEQEGNAAWVPPLSIMFEVMRSWKMPELYERR